MIERVGTESGYPAHCTSIALSSQELDVSIHRIDSYQGGQVPTAAVASTENNVSADILCIYVVLFAYNRLCA